MFGLARFGRFYAMCRMAALQLDDVKNGIPNDQL
jgi:hypothetical protein